MLQATPTMAFIDFVVIVWSQYYGVYGLAALTSMLVARENSALLGVIVALVVSTLCGYGPNLNQGKEWGVGWLQDISFSRWALEAFFHAETLAYRNHYMVVEVSAGIWGYTLDRYALDITLIIILGTILRGIAYFLMVFLNRKEQI